MVSVTPGSISSPANSLVAIAWMLNLNGASSAPQHQSHDPLAAAEKSTAVSSHQAERPALVESGATYFQPKLSKTGSQVRGSAFGPAELRDAPTCMVSSGDCRTFTFNREENARLETMKHTTLATARLRFLFLAAKIWRHAGRVGSATAITTKNKASSAV